MLPECGDVSFLVAPNASEAASTLPPCSWKISAAQAPTLPKPCACNVAVSIITLNTGKMMMGPLLHEGNADYDGIALGLYVPTKPCSALAQCQMYHMHTGSGRTIFA